MRDPKGKTASDLFPGIFADDGEEEREPPITEQEQQELRDLMDAMNAESGRG